MVEAHNERIEEQLTFDRVHAWYAALYSRMKRLPSLRKVVTQQADVRKLEGEELKKARAEDDRIRKRFPD